MSLTLADLPEPPKNKQLTMIRKHLTVTATTVEELGEETNKLQTEGWRKSGSANFSQEFVLEEEGEAERPISLPSIVVKTFCEPPEDLNAQLDELVRKSASATGR
jgi:hypothetical protein